MHQDIRNPKPSNSKSQTTFTPAPPPHTTRNIMPDNKKHKWWPPKLSRKQWLITISGVIAVILLFSIGIWTLFFRNNPEPQPQPSIIQVCQLETKEIISIDDNKIKEDIHSTELTDCEEQVFISELTGLEVTEAQSKLPTTAVMIENSPAARPQSGLEQADLVFEAIAEGGITRFSALYQESKPQNIGPIRSLRPYYIDLFKPFDAPIAHVGGSAEALSQVRTQNIKTLNQMSNAGAYSRVTHRYAPHNVYTSRQRLLDLQKQKDWSKSDFKGYARAEEANPAKMPQATKINFDISSFNYNVAYEYDPDNNHYKRQMAGRPHTDADSSKQIAPAVVIALVMRRSQNGIYSVYRTTGSGQMYVFQDGKAIQGTWSKQNRSSQFVFETEGKETLALTPGKTWVTLVANSNQVTYTK